MKVNEARKQLFSKKMEEQWMLFHQQKLHSENIQRELLIKQVTSGHKCLQQFPVCVPSPGEWGWLQTNDGGWEINWSSLPEASQAYRELLRCGCKKGCRNRCKCVQSFLQCTALCQCGGQCD